MPDPDPKSPSFDFLGDFDGPKQDDPTPTENTTDSPVENSPVETSPVESDDIFDFGEDLTSAEAASPTPDPIGSPPDPIGLPADATIPPGKDVHGDEDLGFFDDLVSEETATTSEPMATPSFFEASTPTESAAGASASDADDLNFFSDEELAPATDSAEATTSAADTGATVDFFGSFDEPGDAPTDAPTDAADDAPMASDLMPPPGDELLAGAAMAGAALIAGGAAATATDDVVPPPTDEEPPLPEDPDIEDPQPTPAPLADDHPHMQTYAKLTTHVRQASALGAIEAVLGWDERCMMPAAGAEQRAEQITLLSGIIHERLVDPRIGEWLNEVADGELTKDPHGDYGTTIRQIRRQYDKRTKLPKELVEELAHTAVLGQHVWQEARKNDDFATFAPLLTKMVTLKQQQADALGFAETRYDALLDEFEPGELTSRVTTVLGALRDELVPLVAQIRDSGKSPDVSILERHYPIETQRTFGRAAAAKIGFDFERGRLDVTAHPFCTGLGANDCRITTRYDEGFFNSGFFGILHEAGHGIYDQGLRADQYGLPMGEAVSMGIHESQSRLWEIFVGRSLPFWRHMYGEARGAFPAALGDVTLGKFYFAVNDVRPSLIRVEADEFTYNLHILIRFELEQAMISGDLQVADLPGAWREKYRSYLGIEPPNDADGVLQDIHWSAGLFGYFPTYSLGNLYAAQFFEQADRELGGLHPRFARGEFNLLRRWLRAKIHLNGQRFTAAELCERITGASLSHAPLMRHLRSKYDTLYAPEAASLDELDVVSPAVAPAATAAIEDYGLAGASNVGASDAGGYGLASMGEAAESATGSMSFGSGSASSTASYRAKKKGGMMTAVIMIVGVVGGGVIGTSLGLWILMWWKGPSGDFLKLRDKLPSFMVPSYTPPPEEEPVEVVPPRGASSPDTSVERSKPMDVSRALTQRVLAAAQARTTHRV